MLARALGVCFIGALQDALRANVNPTARGHLSIHHQAAAGEIIKMFLRGPVRHQI